MKLLQFVPILAIFAMACKKNDSHGDLRKEIIYLESNDFNSNSNSIIAYRNIGDGKLEMLPGSPFLTNGEGIENVEQILGPNDSDEQIKLSKDGKFLLAVNSGSNTIAVFRIGSNGSLSHVAGSPFPSGGKNPVSIGLKDNYVFIVNKSQESKENGENPNYTLFAINQEGMLTEVQGSTFETTEGSSPAQALVSRSGKFLFGADFLGFQLEPSVGTLRSFTIGNDGLLAPVSGTPQTIPEMGGALGLWQHPKEDILYVGFPLAAKVGIYGIEPNTGTLNYISAVSAGPAACWIRTNRNGDRMYVLNSGENTISAYNTSTSQSPQAIGKLTLKNSGPIYQAMGMPFTTSQDFSFEFSKDERYLYVISQHTNPDFSIGNFNYFHVVKVAADGSLSEPDEPYELPVPANVRPQGVAVYK